MEAILCFKRFVILYFNGGLYHKGIVNSTRQCFQYSRDRYIISECIYSVKTGYTNFPKWRNRLLKQTFCVGMNLYVFRL